MEKPDFSVYLVAPNISTQMGGEAMKALQIFEELHAQLGDVIQITHARNEEELKTHRLRSRIEFLRDDLVDKIMWRSVIFRWLMVTRFSYRAVKHAERLAAASGRLHLAIIHQTEPNSPVAFRWTSSKTKNVFGPINGNIYYPKCFRKFERIPARIRRLLHNPAQYLNRHYRSGIRNADLILAAGGERTITSLLAAGVRRERILETLDCGLRDEFLNSELSKEPKSVGRFIHFGRLEFHKGTSLAIQAIAIAAPSVSLDIVGKGPELERCKSLASRLNLGERVRFLDWYESRDELIASLRNYQGMVLPSMEDANGMVVQEAMAAGLVPVCLDWGGPQLLIEHEVSGYLVRPEAPGQVVKDIAFVLERLHDEPILAKRMSANARVRAAQWRWSHIVRDWHDQYNSLFENEAAKDSAAARHLTVSDRDQLNGW